MSRDRFASARDLIASAAAAGAFPAAVVDVGTTAGPIWQEAFGRLTYAPGAAATRLDTWFDLASLTKVISTTSLVMRDIQEGRVSLDTSIANWFAPFGRGPRRQATLRTLLDHSSGLPAHARLWEQASDRAAFERVIAGMALEAQPGTRSVYSDVGFILLGFILEDAASAPLDVQFAPLGHTLGEMQFTPDASLRDRIAPTEVTPDRGLVWGAVHDENAAALGGVAGHAGLFGTADAVAAFARLVLRTFSTQTRLGTPELMAHIAARTTVPGSSRAIGWDTMLPTSSCGTRMSEGSIGHTGFTGTSLWIDVARGVYVVLLTNRVHPTRENEALRRLRPRLHDAIVEALS